MNPIKPVLDHLDTIIHDVENALKVDNSKAANTQSTAEPSTTGKTSVNEAAAVGKSKEATVSDPSGKASEKKSKKKEKKKKENGASTGKDGKPVPLPLEQSQWLQCDIRVGRVSSVGEHPELSGLYVLQVSYGDEMEPRTVCAGLRNFIPADEMSDRRVVTICNLKPRKLRGIESQAMILAGSVVSESAGKEKVETLVPPTDAPDGAIVSVIGMEGLSRTVEKGKNVSGKTWDKVGARLSVKNGEACYDGARMSVGTEAVLCNLPDGSEIH